VFKTIRAGTGPTRTARSKGAVRALFVANDDLERSLKAAFERAGTSGAAAAGFRGDAGEVRVIDATTVLVGLGKSAAMGPFTVRNAAGRLVRALDQLQARDVVILVDDAAIAAADTPGESARHTFGRKVGEGMATANWRVTGFDGTAATRKSAQGGLVVDADRRETREGIAAGLALGESVNYARGIGATPPNVCTPGWIANEAKSLARGTKLKVRIISYAEAKRLGMGGLVAVGQGSTQKPCIAILEWKPAKTTRAAKNVHLCLVGKTITYDTGGYSLKVNNGMKGMKYDKCGGTAVFGAMHAIASAKLPIRVTALLPAAENMVAGDSYRPDDIITMHNGVTVEVTNTDAEGRLVLADAMAYACRTMKPTHLVDIATLTGGVVTALGSWCAGLMCNDESLRAQVEKAGAASGDRVWHLPLWNEHRDHMRSQHADIINSNPSRLGHPLQGGAFLSYFVDDKLPWAHIDIAGVANVDSPNDTCSVAGPTGFGVRLLYDLAADLAGTA
jgi:leucyl aminopeptidase